jgi:hypothetical protein
MKIKFTPSTDIAANFPPVPIKHRLPDWYKGVEVYSNIFNSTEDFFDKNSPYEPGSVPFTVKKCIPVLDYLTSGYLIPFCSDIFIKPTEEDGFKSYKWASPYVESNAVDEHGHPHRQCPISINNHKHHYIKFSLQWAIKTPPGYSTLLYQPFYEFQNKISLFPAIVDTDKYDNIVNIPGYVNTDKSFMIKAGDPFMVAFPFKREEWKMDIDKDLFKENKTEFYKLKLYKFFGIYKDFFHSKKKYN